MSYYQGDFYRGDYYAGDPGLFGFLGKAFKAVAGTAAGFIPGVGPGVQKLLGGGAKVAAAAGGMTGTHGMTSAASSMLRRGVAAVKGHPVLSAAGAAGALGAGTALMRGGHPAAAAGAAMRGYHISKKTGALVRNRRMNVCNPRALRRSLRRAHGFAKLAMRTIHIVHPKKKGRFGGFKVRRRRAGA
jgi:hypothetical protein